MRAGVGWMMVFGSDSGNQYFMCTVAVMLVSILAKVLTKQYLLA